MNDGVIIDANIISEFYKELRVDSGNLYELINSILDTYGIAICELIEHEWNSTCNNEIIQSWVADGLKLNKIRYVEPQLDAHVAKKIRVKYGLPISSRDIQYIRCANVTLIKYILTKDMDLYDPKLKEADSEAQIQARNNRKGKLCKFLKKELEITVGTPEHCTSDLSIR